MSIDFIEPDPQAIDDIFENISISQEDKKMLLGFFSEDGISVNAIPDMFTQKEDNNPQVFKPQIKHIFSYIRTAKQQDEAFLKAYNEKLQEIRNASSFKERACYYLKQCLQNLPKRTYEPDEKPPEWEKIESLMKSNAYPFDLTTELEELPEGLFSDINFNIQAFPYIICGTEVFKFVNFLLTFLKILRSPHDKNSFDHLIPQIEVPKYNSKNSIHEFSFLLAAGLQNMTILDRIFEETDASTIPYVFFDYITDQSYSFYRSLLMGNCLDAIKPILCEIEYLDWALAPNNLDVQKLSFEKCRLLVDYLKHLLSSKSLRNLALFQELSFLRKPNYNHYYRTKTIKDVLNDVAQERKIQQADGSTWIVPNQQKEADNLYEKFLDVIARGVAACPVELFLAPRNGNANDYEICNDEYDLDVFKQYCTHLRFEKAEDVILVAQVWFLRFHGYHQCYEYNYDVSKFAEKESFFYKNVFSQFMDDEEFICRFLSIPLELHQTPGNAGYCWIAYYLARWILWRNKQQVSNDVFMDASEELMHGDKIIFPKKVTELIRLEKMLDRLLGGNSDAAKLFLCYAFAALGESKTENNTSLSRRILERLFQAKADFPFYRIQYRYTHEEFDPDGFSDFLFDQKEPVSFFSSDAAFPLRLIQTACEENILTKQVVLPKLTDFLNKHTELKSYETRGVLSYFMEPEEGKYLEEQTAFFIPFYERAVDGNDSSYAGLYEFLKLRSSCYEAADSIFINQQKRLDELITRCSKALHFIKNIEQDHYDCVFLISDFVSEKTSNIWKALKPLLVAFRNSKRILLDESLDGYFSPTPELFRGIIHFFLIQDREKLIELRCNMANDFAEYLKPIPEKDLPRKMRDKEQYTETEKKEKGFNPSYTEPSALWRYAYVRALYDLGVRTDNRGHFFHDLLTEVSINDPSEEVKKAASRTLEELDGIRRRFAGSNHKKCLFESFWWIRQAHMLSLGAEIDPKEANIRRITEWR